MKRLMNYTFLKSLLLSLLVFSCAEDFNDLSEGRVPLAADIDVEITIDQEINLVTFKLKNKGSYPVWIFTEPSRKVYSTTNGLTKIYNLAGTYTVEVRIGNSSGISDGSIEKTFTINNSIVDFDRFNALIAGAESKTWSIAAAETGHLACGPSGTVGTEWYQAAPNEKVAEGLYDDELTFDTDMNYTYNPGVGGTLYANKDVTVFPDNPNNGADFMQEVDEQSTTFEFIGEGNDVFLKFPAETLFPYIANNDAYNNPKYKVINITSNRLELVIDNGAIAWHYILTAGDGSGPGGYNPDHECNMWTDATFTNGFYYAPNWGQIADPELDIDGNSYTVTLPEATFAQWQAQMFFKTDLSTVATKKYDFSAVINSTKAHGNVTVKLVHETDDGNYYFEEGIVLNANEDYVFIKTGMDGKDMNNIRLFLDFGGNEANTVVNISRVVLKENDCDDGTVINEPVDDTNWLPNSACNLWKNVTYVNHFFYAPGWVASYEGPSYSGFTAGANTYTLSYPTATSDQWQNQVHFRTNNIATTADKTYDFRVIFNSNKNINGVTIKLTKVGDDATFFFTNRVNLVAFEDFTFKMPDMPGKDIDNIALVFDFGGNPADTEITVSSIILKESACNN